MNKAIYLVGTWKSKMQGRKYYQAIVGVGSPMRGNHRVLHRRWPSQAKAMDYLRRFYRVWYKYHPGELSSKKQAKFS